MPTSAYDGSEPLIRLPDRFPTLTPKLSMRYGCWQWRPETQPGVVFAEAARVLGGAPAAATEADAAAFAAAAHANALVQRIALRLQARGAAQHLRRWQELARVLPPMARTIVLPFVDTVVAARAVQSAAALLLRLQAAVRETGSLPAVAEIETALKLATRHCAMTAPYVSMMDVLFEAMHRGIPVRRHSDLPSYLLGHGSRQRRMRNGYTDRTSELGTRIATLKPMANALLRAAGLPVAAQRVATTLAEAQAAMQEIGPPVVVKPAATDKGTGVTVGVASEAAMQAAWAGAAPHGRVLIESQIAGDDHRLHVMGNDCIAVLRRLPAQVVGNGRDDIETLIATAAAERARQHDYHGFPPATLDDPLVQAELVTQGLAPETVPAAGQRVRLRSNANVSTGGTIEDVAPRAHPDNLALAVEAARVVGLDHAGVDFITPDIAVSWRDGVGAICEINPTPGMLDSPTRSRVLDGLFPNGSDGRIPVIVVAGRDADALGSWARQFADAASAAGITVGWIVDGVRHRGGSGSSPSGGAFRSRPGTLADQVPALLADTAVQAALIAFDPSELADGATLDLDRCTLLITTAGLDDATEARLAARYRPLRTLRQPDAATGAAAITEALTRAAAPTAPQAS